jgi:HEPN domain-containing protein
MREETRNWIRQANKDLGTAGFALNSVDGPLPVTTGLHCQKSAENYLKAYLHEHAVAISSQQTLTSLLEVCMAVDASFEDLHSDIDQLEGYSIASRYPKAEDSLELRKEAIATATRVKDFIMGKLA